MSFDGFVPIREAVSIAQRAEELGARSYWIAEHLGYREAFSTATAIAMHTRTGRIVPTAISPYLRHPMPMAMALASLDELAPGRAGVAVGVGNPLFLKENGLAAEKPLAAVRDYLEALGGLLAGQPQHKQGQTFSLDGAKLAFTGPQSVPLYVAAMGPAMLKLSGAVANGVLLSAGLSTQYSKHQLDAVAGAAKEAGRDPAKVRKASYVYFMADSGGTAARQTVREKLAFLFRNDKIKENLAYSGIQVDQEAVMAAIARRDTAAAAKLVPDEAIHQLTIFGDVATCRRRIREYLDAGLEEIVLSLIGNKEQRLQSLETLPQIH
ncbi:LLM class flavin-dependent oxidoreductase [Ramlibacter tataouinensis]|uniref:LLM class flavin-dependent oxidoreductase n=1 Tax=Ramlibacter tataouinensis TaxID=94132 RepID=UPI0022F3A422|nr:LLM class flavin-dependent oxidoreductase [Ramlibacter tataouinensis]WBY00554.1 LLM class flavin-dependent oxidoreductase [Ramlibacter tataouinensis]